MTSAERVAASRVKHLAIQLVAELQTWNSELAEDAIVSYVALIAAGLAAPTRGDQSISLAEMTEGLKLLRSPDAKKP